jgi:hypothetical protein
MKTTVTKHDFREAFRTLRPDNFSYEGLGELFDYIEELEEDAGMKEIELDVIAFCVDFSEYESIEEFQTDYGDEYKDWDDVDEHTTVIPVGDGAIVASF